MKRAAPLLLIPLVLAGCQPKTEPAAAPPAEAAAPPPPAPDSPEGKIMSATSAAPASIAAQAAVMDFGATMDAPMVELRKGTNGWMCIPDMAMSPGKDPMCLDASFGQWAEAWMQHKDPKLTQPAVSYMLQGSSDASNTDPFAMEPPAGQTWIASGPHIMVAVPNPKSLDGMNDDSSTGGPWVMYKGTPYAHLMIPIR